MNSELWIVESTWKIASKNVYRILLLLSLFSLLLTSGCIPNEPKITGMGSGIISTQNTVSLEGKQTLLPISVEKVSEIQEPEILYEGVIALFTKVNESEGAAFIDLDKGKNGLGDMIDGDLEFRANSGTMVFYSLLPHNGATAYKGEGTNPDFDQCYKSLDLFSTGSIPDFFESQVVCFLTTEGRIAAIKYDPDSIHVGYQGQASILLSITIWEPASFMKNK